MIHFMISNDFHRKDVILYFFCSSQWYRTTNVSFHLCGCFHFLNVIYAFQRTNIVAVQNNFTLQFIPVLFNLVVFNHNDNHVDII